MKKTAWFAAACAAVMAAGMAHAADDNLIGLTTPNGKIAYDFINLWFNEGKGVEAWDKYVSRDHYMNHAVYSASRDKHPSFEEEKQTEARMGGTPGTHFDIKQLVAQGSLVFAHIHVAKADGPGRELVMILRVRDGKITDHWDIHEALKEDSVVFDQLER
ncbi:MAG: nuclear transport factor 2 family protein [Steroidobacteraceae bacterium]